VGGAEEGAIARSLLESRSLQARQNELLQVVPYRDFPGLAPLFLEPEIPLVAVVGEVLEAEAPSLIGHAECVYVVTPACWLMAVNTFSSGAHLAPVL
jgi:hypothetical protein